MDQPAFSSAYWSRRVTRRGVIRGAAIGAAGLTGAALLGCSDNGSSPSPTQGAGGPTGEPVRGGELRLATVSNTVTRDPAFSLGTPDHTLTLNVFDNLVLEQHDATLRPMLAETLEPNEELTEYVAQLRPGVTFHHGKAFDAEDVLHTFNRLIDPDLGSPAAAALSSIERVERVDDMAVRFVLKAPDAFLPDALGIYQARITPSDIDPSEYARTASGTGPYRMVEHRDNEHTTFERNEEYWDDPQPYLDRMTWFYMGEPATRIEALKSGNVDILFPVDEGQLRSLEDDPNLVISEQDSGTYLNLAMRTDMPPFNDIRVRQAFQSLTDREFILEAVSYGRGLVANDHPIPPFDPHFWPGQVQPPFDLTEARRHLDATDYAGGLQVTLHTSSVTPGMPEMALAFQELARQIGITINIQRAPEDTYWSSVWLVEPFTTVGYNARTVDQALSTIYPTGAAWNESYYSNTEVDELLAQARGIRDQEERTETYGRVQQILIDEVPRIIPIFRPNFIAMARHVGGVAAHPSRWLMMHRAWRQQ